jgi:hypothetical protein
MKSAHKSPKIWPAAVLCAALSIAALVSGCNTYHYYDIDVKAASPVTQTQISGMQFCQILISGADSHTINWTQGIGCPPQGFPDIGSFEFSSYADSGNITFTFNGYSMNLDASMLCSTASTTLPANGTITQAGTITLTSFNVTACPPHVTP